MSTHWTDKRTSVAMVGSELARRGWKLWGWKADHSDSQTDYYDPESWVGVATRDEWIVCVDVSGHDVESRSSKPDQRHACLMGLCSPCGGTGKQQRDYDTPGSVMTELFSGKRVVEPAEHFKAGDPCRWCKGTGQREESRQIPDAPVWPTFQANPHARVWHVERDGRIVASGVGVYAVACERWKDDKPRLKALVDRIEAATAGPKMARART